MPPSLQSSYPNLFPIPTPPSNPGWASAIPLSASLGSLPLKKRRRPKQRGGGVFSRDHNPLRLSVEGAIPNLDIFL